MMTGKEAIEYLRDHNRYYEPVNREAFRVIEEDLEKLEQYEKIFSTPLAEIRKRLEVLDNIRKTFKVQKEETINQNHYWLYIGNHVYMITKKIYDLVKDELEGENND